MIPYGRQEISEEDIAEVVETLQSDFLTQGPKTPLFEKIVADYCGSKYGVAANSATSALHIACLALDLTKGDRLWTSPNSFVASANCALYCGAQVDFVDIDPLTYNLSAEALEKKLIQAKQDNKLPKIVIPVHFAGQSCDMQKIHSLGKEYGFKIIEDASHAIGGSYLNNKIGICEYSDITVFSFHPVKIITTAEGGLATTNERDLFERMQLFRTHGVTRDPKIMTKETEGAWYYQQVDLGFNYRMTELQAALGISQMRRLDEFVNKRNILKNRYDQLLSELPVIKPHQSNNITSALHLYPIQIDTNKTKVSRYKVYDSLKKGGIGVNVHYIPIHTQPYYQEMGFAYGDFPIAETYYSNAISLPLFSQMSSEEQDKVVTTLSKALK
ncbi:UDP-4-amino-4,6-dideoxy-N-acetyl-beta-L-altrosamine transaminase [Gammaproteobacteria bacterium]|nr:UDP-4-amino-4,6-dideoxy-N-acetyl-beta-L-altrosamine transaminase [Gammaproteobacteria bacterium]